MNIAHTILLCGDSLTLRRGVSADPPLEASCTYFDWALHSLRATQHQRVNLGRGGARLTLPNPVYQEPSLLDCIDQQLTDTAPSVIAVLIGLNDILLEGLPADELSAPLLELLGKCRRHCAGVLVGTYPPVRLEERNDEINAERLRLNALIREIPERAPGTFIMDMENAYQAAQINACTSDGIHPNPLGAQAMANCARDTIERCLRVTS